MFPVISCMAVMYAESIGYTMITTDPVLILFNYRYNSFVDMNYDSSASLILIGHL